MTKFLPTPLHCVSSTSTCRNRRTHRSIMVRSLACVSAAVAAVASPALAFAPLPAHLTTIAAEQQRTSLRMAPPGGWGIPGAGGTSFRDEEFADNRGRSNTGRRGYDAYELENRGAFMKRVRDEQKGLKQRKKDELMSIAKMAGIKTKKKEGLYGKFDADDFEDFPDDDDDIDLRVTDEK